MTRFNIYLAAISVVFPVMASLPEDSHRELNFELVAWMPNGKHDPWPATWCCTQIGLPNLVCTTNAASLSAPPALDWMLSVIAVVHICCTSECVKPPARSSNTVLGMALLSRKAQSLVSGSQRPASLFALVHALNVCLPDVGSFVSPVKMCFCMAANFALACCATAAAGAIWAACLSGGQSCALVTNGAAVDFLAPHLSVLELKAQAEFLVQARHALIPLQTDAAGLATVGFLTATGFAAAGLALTGAFTGTLPIFARIARLSASCSAIGNPDTHKEAKRRQRMAVNFM
ncbi:hypothetical protein DFH09DRAFT_1119192, partial [Mycena vulgaris]